MSFVQEQAPRLPCRLAMEHGPFPAYKGSVYESQGIMRRNATLTAIATGTLSLIAGV